ncbi:MAG: hypothetical protein KGK08_04560 [Acidobacteriota bacterium]|nr:hypothetical protein [Acidobacteriota bacterium]
MNEFEAKVLTELSVLKSQMEQLIGIGQPGRLALLEERVEMHGRSVQRIKGWMGAAGCALTLMHLALERARH